MASVKSFIDIDRQVNGLATEVSSLEINVTTITLKGFSSTDIIKRG